MVIQSLDYSLLADIWLRVSLTAHDFIDADHWRSNRKAMCETYLPSTENYVFTSKNNAVQGFVSVAGEHIEALFVDIPFQRQGVGGKLVDFVKNRCAGGKLTVTVYEENKKAVRFYLANGFVVTDKGIDSGTGHPELYMEWTPAT